MWPFRRRPARHTLGAAVTSILATPERPPATAVRPQSAGAATASTPELDGTVGAATEPVVARLTGAPVLAATLTATPAGPAALAPLSASQALADSIEALLRERHLVLPEPTAAAQPLELEAPGPQVHLGFRDGSVTALEPGSEQARALQDLARTLTGRD